MAIIILDENDKKELEQKIEDAANSAGTDGGHYTPSVEDNGDGTMTISFTASKEGMAAVNPVTVSLPVPADGENGEDGTDGGYYTPSVETVTENSFKISFTASKADMPYVADVTITLPAAKDGEDGEDGVDGVTPHIGENGNWWVGDTDTGKNAAKVKWDTVTVFDESIADTDTLYILPDGSIKMYSYVEEGGGEPLFTNLADPTADSWKSSSRLRTGSGVAVVDAAVYEKDLSVVTNIITAKLDDYIYITGLDTSTRTDATATQLSVIMYNAEGAAVNVQPFVLKMPACGSGNVMSGCQCWDAVETDENGVYKWKFAYNNAGTAVYKNMVSFQVGGLTTDGPDGVIVTVNDPIEYTEPYKGYKWITADFKIPACECSEDVTKLKTHVNNLQKQVNNLLEAVSLPDKKPVWYAFGDSITEGSVSYITADGTPGSKVTPSLEQGWVYTTARVCGFDLTNHGVGGSGYSYCINDQTPDAKTIISGVDFSECDLVTLAWGINDWKSDRASIGSLDDDKDTGTTPCAALKWCIEHIQTENPLCKIVVITPLNIVRGNEAGFWAINANLPNTGTLGDFSNKITEICEYYGVTCVDMTHNSIITRLNLKSLLLDNIHPTADAHKAIGHEIAGRLGFR